jgi:predicted nicotinamide N-methyase
VARRRPAHGAAILVRTPHVICCAFCLSHCLLSLGRAVAWPGGQGVARYVLDNPAAVRNKRVLDVGAGGGVAALACLQSGASFVAANDTCPHALAACAANARANGLGDALTDGRLALDAANHLGALASAADVAALLARYDVILAGDMTYLAPLAAAMRALLASGGAVSASTSFLLGHASRERVYADVAGGGLRQVAAYTVEDADADALVEGRTQRGVTVWTTA